MSEEEPWKTCPECVGATQTGYICPVCKGAQVVKTEPRFKTCDTCDSEYDTLEGDCPVCLMLYGTSEQIEAHLSKEKR